MFDRVYFGTNLYLIGIFLEYFGGIFYLKLTFFKKTIASRPIYSKKWYICGMEKVKSIKKIGSSGIFGFIEGG